MPVGSRLVVACSGGADSTALVVAVGQLRDLWPSVAVAFVDHGLRDIRAERRAAEEAAARIGAPFTAARVVVESSGNLQAAARNERYRALAAVDPGAIVLTAHTADDQAETLVMRLLRSGGLRAWRGIAPRLNDVARPALTLSRTDLRSVNAPFAEDPTNAGDRYARNRLRHHVMPTLEAFQPGATQAIARAASHAHEAVSLLDELLRALDVDSQPLSGLPRDVLAPLIQWKAARADVGPLRAASLRDAVERLAGGARTGRVALGHDNDLVIDDGAVRFAKRNDGRFTIVAHTTGTYRLGTMALTITSLNGTRPSPTGDGWLIPDTNAAWPLTIRLSRESAPGFRVNDSRGNQVVPIRKAAGTVLGASAKAWLHVGMTTHRAVVVTQEGTYRANTDKGLVER